MDKNSVTGMILIAAILGAFWWLNKPSAEEIEAQKRYQDSIAKVEAVAAKEAALESSNMVVENEVASVTVDDSTTQQQLADKYGLFADAVKGENKFYTLENERIKVTFSSRGAKVYSVQLKEYTNFEEKALVLFDGDKNQFGFNFFHNNRILNTNHLFYSIDEAASNDSTLRFKLSVGDDQFMAFEYKLSSNSYLLDFNIVQNNMDDVIQSNRGGLIWIGKWT